MANINQISSQSTNNQKVVVEELIESELKGIVGGTDATNTTVIQDTVVKISGANSSISIIKDVTQPTVVKDPGIANLKINTKQLRFLLGDVSSLLKNLL